MNWLRLFTKAFVLPGLIVRGWSAARYAKRHEIPGLEFDDYGRRLGWRLLSHNVRLGLHYLLTPVEFTRYWEFSFAYSCLPTDSLRTLDISSPSLFDFVVSSAQPERTIDVRNPDRADCEITRLVASTLGFRNIGVSEQGVENLATCRGSYDCVWSISVVEHIAGGCDDIKAMRLMFDVLRPGGRLIVTIPTDVRRWDEYREVDHYGTQPRASDGSYFFQRFYDWPAIDDRLLAPLGVQPSVLRWFGESEPGRFHAFTGAWLREGRRSLIDSPREVIDHFQEYSAWEEMPGVGVCGLAIDKPK